MYVCWNNGDSEDFGMEIVVFERVNVSTTVSRVRRLFRWSSRPLPVSEIGLQVAGDLTSYEQGQIQTRVDIT